MKYSIVIPCYNEGDNIPFLIERIKPLIDDFDVEFILVENGSCDGSREIFNNIDVKGIKVVFVDVNRGYGYGVKQGIISSQGDYIGWIHADMQIPPESLRRFFGFLNKRKVNDKVLLKGSRVNRRPSEEFFTVGQSIFSTIVFGKLMRDVSAVPILISRSFFEENNIEDMPNDFALDIYVYYMALVQKYRLKRIVVEYAAREHGSSSWSNGLKSKIKQSKRIIKDSFMIKNGKKII